jgi:hypothetical protein
VPKFLYRALRDETQGFAAISGSGRIAPLQDGIWERMLCRKCEGKLQQWEDGAARILRRWPDLSAKMPGHVEPVSGVAYKPFKLFCIHTVEIECVFTSYVL